MHECRLASVMVAVVCFPLRGICRRFWQSITPCPQGIWLIIGPGRSRDDAVGGCIAIGGRSGQCLRVCNGPCLGGANRLHFLHLLHLLEMTGVFRGRWTCISSSRNPHLLHLLLDDARRWRVRRWCGTHENAGKEGMCARGGVRRKEEGEKRKEA